MVTPIGALGLLLGKIAPYAAIGFVDFLFALEILRGIVLRGAGIGELWRSVAAMLGLTVALLVAATLRFARRTIS